MLKVNFLHNFWRYISLGVDMVIAKILKYAVIFFLAASGLRAQDAGQGQVEPKKEVLEKLLNKAQEQLKVLLDTELEGLKSSGLSEEVRKKYEAAKREEEEALKVAREQALKERERLQLEGLSPEKRREKIDELIATVRFLKEELAKSLGEPEGNAPKEEGSSQQTQQEADELKKLAEELEKEETNEIEKAKAPENKIPLPPQPSTEKPKEVSQEDEGKDVDDIAALLLPQIAPDKVKAVEKPKEVAKVEEPKTEEKPAQPPKVDEPKPAEKPAEVAKAEEPKVEAKPEEKPNEVVKKEEPKAEEKPAEVTKVEEQKPEEKPAEVAKVEESPKEPQPVAKAEEPKAEPTPTTAKAEEPKPQEQKVAKVEEEGADVNDVEGLLNQQVAKPPVKKVESQPLSQKPAEAQAPKAEEPKVEAAAPKDEFITYEERWKVALDKLKSAIKKYEEADRAR